MLIDSNRRVVFASGPTAVFCEDAVRHGVKYERYALTQLSAALGVSLYPQGSATSVRLARDFEVRVKPDATNLGCPLEPRVIFEVKCPYTEAARNSIRDRMRQHGRQCFLELLAFPRAACLVFAVFDFDPGSSTGHSYRDSVLHRLNRTSVQTARLELERLDLLHDLANHTPNETVDGILQRMLAEAIGLPGVKDMTPDVAQRLLPELFLQNASAQILPLDSTDPPVDANELN